VGNQDINQDIIQDHKALHYHSPFYFYFLISYGWSLDCSWLDIADLDPGPYVLVIETNPARVFPEVSFDNNRQSVVVTIPAVETASFKATSAASEIFSSHGHRCTWDFEF
jgi:hypothetical protein